jgi:LacI family transcriptional regulator
MATIKDVAKRAGVSISTASYALNNVPYVKPSTKVKVLKAAQELNFTPNANARNLKTKKTKNIGVFVYGFSGPVFSDLLEGINKAVHQLGYNIIVTSGLSSAILLKERQVDAAIIFDSMLDQDVLLQYATQAPVVILDRQIEGNNIFHSLINNEMLVNQLIHQVIDKGYKKFAYLSGPKDAFNNQERYKGFLRALHDRNLKPFAQYQGDFTIQSGYMLGKKIIQSSSRPDFVFCANDESALGLMRALKEDNINIPNDIGIAGFDGVYLKDSFIKPSLTTIAINHFKWGQDATEFLVDVLNEKKLKHVVPPIGIIVMNGSC